MDDEKAKKFLLTGPVVIRGLGRGVKDALLPGRPSRHRAFVDGGAEDVAPTPGSSAVTSESTTVGPRSASDDGASPKEGSSAPVAPLTAVVHPVRDAGLDAREEERADGSHAVVRSAGGADASRDEQTKAGVAVSEAGSTSAEWSDHEPRSDAFADGGLIRDHDSDVPRDWMAMEELYRRLVTMSTSDRTGEDEADPDGRTRPTP